MTAIHGTLWRKRERPYTEIITGNILPRLAIILDLSYIPQ